jgi:hypothetical protein
VLATKVTMISNGVWLPIIDVMTQAPDVTAARRLADSAVLGLTQYLESKAAAEAVPAANRLRVSGLGNAQAGTETRGPKPMLALIVALLLFAVGCATILVTAAIVRGLRATDADLDAPRPVQPHPVYREDFQDDWAEDELPARVVQLRPAESDRVKAAADTPSAPQGGSASSWWGGGPA